MANNYHFNIKGLDPNDSVQGLSSVVGSVDFEFIAENENGIFVSILGKQPLPPPNSDSFIQYEDVTKADIISWLESVIDMDGLKANADRQLKSVTTPPNHLELNDKILN